MFSAEKKVGRLIEVRVRGPIGDQEVAGFRGHFIDVLRDMRPDDKIVAVADFRGARPVAPPIAGLIVNLLRATNHRMERGAVVISDEPVGRMQAQRILDEARHPGRKLCLTVADAVDWMRPTLTVAELGRLQRFLADG